MKDLTSGTYAVFHTNQGDFTVRLFPDKAPKTVENFVGLATGLKEYRDPKSGKATKGKFYDGLVFHRVIKDFMIQGGDPEGTGRGGPGYRFEDEFHPSLNFGAPGKLAMANAGPNTNGSQFFITVKPTSWLNNKHTVFGEVIEGFDVVEKISLVKTASMDRPASPVVIKTLEIKAVE